VLVWVSQDTLRADHLGAYGYDRDTSPNFDRLGRGFTVFDRAVSPASWTLPALASQMTSRYPSFHGATHRLNAADTRFPTLFETLAQAGFTVLGVTGNPFVSPKYTLTRGFDALTYTGLRADVVSRLARQLVDQWGGGDLALFVHYMDPHDPYNPPEPYRKRFGKPYAGEVNGYNHRSAARTEEDVQHVRDLYDGEVAFTDHEIAGLLEALGQKGILDQAVIAYSADHGEELKDHGGWGHAHTLHEELLHVPFALRIPGVAARRIAMPVSLVDLAPTLLDVLGIQAPSSYQGRSLLPLARGGTLSEIPLFYETARAKWWHKVAVREGRFKYVADFNASEGETRERRREDLFDLEADPGEQAGLVEAPETERLRKEVEGFLARAHAAGTLSRPAVLNPDEEEELRALGYVN
jgi:arylsulfatase A-like enzyme